MNVEMPQKLNGAYPTLDNMGLVSPGLDTCARKFVNYASLCDGEVLDLRARFGFVTSEALKKGANVIACDNCTEHLKLLEQRTPDYQQKRLKTMVGGYPKGVDFTESSLDAVFAYRALNCLRPEQVDEAIQEIYRWLKPEGRLYLLSSTPYVNLKKNLHALYKQNLEQGKQWPGIITDFKSYCSKDLVPYMPDEIHVFDETMLKRVLNKQASPFKIHEMEFSHLTNDMKKNGRENLYVIASPIK